MRILEEFWYGNIEPTEYDTNACKEYSSKSFFDSFFNLNSSCSFSTEANHPYRV